MYLILVLIVCVHLEEVFSSRALSLRHGFWARDVGEFGDFPEVFVPILVIIRDKMLVFVYLAFHLIEQPIPVI